MEGSGVPDEVLLERPWLPLNISGRQLLAKTWFGDAEYCILLTDMQCVWQERMTTTAIQSRAQELNKRLHAPVKAFFSHLCDVAQPCLSGHQHTQSESQITLTCQEVEKVSVRLKSELAGLPFHWEFHCTPAPVTTVCSQLMRPLLFISRLLQNQVEQLEGLLVRKDAEIQDYRENGATLTRERLRTLPFEEQTYRDDFLTQTLPQVCSGQQEDLGFDTSLQHLYTTVITHVNARTHERKLSERHASQELQPDANGQEVDQAADHIPTPGEGATRSGPGDGDREQSLHDPACTAETKVSDKPPQHQTLPDTADPADPPCSRPKKKKAKGLFS
ncbi:non-homologous end-joining factor 1 isoform X2 [Lampris incognitus]|nr:non-homologous end-joining factor 1 isoform X2 [Lampris incognitus]XP_056156973.1 non-homologous end-joining factor 1 isoform X2 [Lampris incognitus]